MSQQTMAAHQAWLQHYQQRGGATVAVACPHCGQDHETARPTDTADLWDSLVSCPHCDGTFFKQVTTFGSRSTVPGMAPITRGWFAEV